MDIVYSAETVRLHDRSDGPVPPGRCAGPYQRDGGVPLPPGPGPARELVLPLQHHRGPWALSLRHHARAELPYAV